MKSVGEAMAIGQTFKESLQKAIRSLELNMNGLSSREGLDRGIPERIDRQQVVELVRQHLRTPIAERLWHVADGMRLGLSNDELFALTKIDPWFLQQIRELMQFEALLVGQGEKKPATVEESLHWRAKQLGFSDERIAELVGTTSASLRKQRIGDGQGRSGVTYKRVDTCAAEFEAYTPYLYSTYGSECEARRTDRKKVIILGGGPNRIGQGIEFDYCCVHAAMALREEGIESIMVNCNPETVSTDYDISDRLYFEPLTLEDVLRIVETEKPEGVIVQFGGQTPLGLALPLQARGVSILGTSPDSIDLAEHRQRFGSLLQDLDIPAPEWGTARSLDEAKAIGTRIGYPLLIRPSY